jgi:hypothetical protein
MRRIPVSSSNLAEIGYDDTSRTLEILFRDDSLYQYFDIPQQEFDALKNAASKGHYLSTNIKGRYRYARV